MENLSNSIPFLESDRCTTSYVYYDYIISYNSSFSNIHNLQGIILDFSLQLIILSFSLYTVKFATAISLQLCHTQMYQMYKSLQLSNEMTVILFWSIFSVLVVVNMSCFSFEISWIIMRLIFETSWIQILLNILLLIYPYVFMGLEICILLCCFSKHTILSSRICCFFKHWIVRVIYSFAILNIFWFAHRVGKCVLIFMCFIASYPATTLAVTTSLVSLIVISIVANSSLTYVCFISNSGRCAKVNVVILLSMLLSLIIFVLLFSLIFVNFTYHGLSATSIVTFILSLAIPVLMIVISVPVKRYVKQVIFNDDDNNNSIHNMQRTTEYQQLLGDIN